MMKIPYEKVIEKVVNESGESRENIEAKIKEKMNQLSGLISQEGAAHIIANQYGVQVFDQNAGKVQIKDIVPNIRGLELPAKILRNYGLKEFNVNERKGKLCSLLVGDETGRIRFVFWGSIAEKVKDLKENDIVRIKDAYSKENNGYKEVHLNDRSSVEVNPEGVEISVKAPEVNRKKISELEKNDSNVELLGTIVDVFEPRFFEICSQCNRRVKEEEGTFKCNDHPEAEIQYSYVANAFIDDGTANIRAVFFRNVLEKLFSKNPEDMKNLRNDQEEFNKIKENLLGSMIKLMGRVSYNEMFDRLEFMSNDLDLNPDPQEEIDKVKKEENAD